MDNNEKIRNLWLRSVAGTMCRLPCAECRDIMTEGCPLDAEAKQEDIYKFIDKVTKLLFERLEREETLPFPVDITEEDVANLIIEAGNE